GSHHRARCGADRGDARRRSSLRPLPRSDHVSHQGRARTCNRLRWTRPRSRRAEVPQLSRDGPLPQRTRALRAARDPALARKPRAPVGRRRLYGCRPPPPVRNRVCGRDPGYGNHPRALSAHLPPGERGRVCLRRRSRRPRSGVAREGREIRFLFLPEGHDPDTLVGEEGREAFERRLESTLPLSEYLVRELSEQTDLTHADGRARFAESARPLIAKVPEGVYRELLTARVAEVVGLSAERLQALWGESQGDERPRWSAGRGAPPPGTASGTADPAAERRSAGERPRARLSGGRGSLVRQAIARLVRFPSIAGSIDGAERAGLDTCEEPGIELLRELLDDLRVRPLSVPA